MNVKLSKWDTSEILETEEDISIYLTESFSTGDFTEIRKALNNVAKARYMTNLAEKMGINRRELYKMLLAEDGDLDFADVRKFLRAVGVEIPVTHFSSAVGS